MSISILIPTLNEEVNLRECIASVSWSDDIVVYDSLSTDKTREIAQAMGARVFEKAFEDNESEHRNHALHTIPFKHRWILYLDADERCTPELRDEILAIAANPNLEPVAYYVRFKNFFMGRWVKHAMPPVWIPRFYQPQKFRYHRRINFTWSADGGFGYLQNMIDHYTFNKGLSWWLEKHNKYSSLEALEGLAVLEKGGVHWPALLGRDPVARRRNWKRLSYYVPARGLVKFFYIYILNRGFMDGYPGLVYCAIHSFWEHMTALKMKELRWHKQSKKF